jgi:asparagine synthase (glutamine-hydrolysing)
LENVDLHLKLTEGMHSWLHCHGIGTLERARELVDANLTGWDGGTIVPGYTIVTDYERDCWYRFAPDEATLVDRLFSGFCGDVTWPGLTDSEACAVCAADSICSLARESFRAAVARTRHYPFDRRTDYFYLRQHVLRSTINMVVFTRSAIEVRCPFFDYSVISFLFSLPSHVRRTTDFYRHVIHRRAPSMTTVPYDRDNQLPTPDRFRYYRHAALERGKRLLGRRIPSLKATRPWLYADYEEYLRTDLREWAEGILFDPRSGERGLFNQEAVRSLWERHLSGNELWTIGKIAPLIEIERVMRMIDEF